MIWEYGVVKKCGFMPKNEVGFGWKLIKNRRAAVTENSDFYTCEEILKKENLMKKWYLLIQRSFYRFGKVKALKINLNHAECDSEKKWLTTTYAGKKTNSDFVLSVILLRCEICWELMLALTPTTVEIGSAATHGDQASTLYSKRG